MKKQFFEIEKDGFYGTYYENPKGSDCVVIGLFGDDPNDFMAKCGAKWLHKNGVNALCYGFSQLRALEFFVFRKMEMPETQNPPAMRVESISL